MPVKKPTRKKAELTGGLTPDLLGFKKTRTRNSGAGGRRRESEDNTGGKGGIVNRKEGKGLRSPRSVHTPAKSENSKMGATAGIWGRRRPAKQRVEGGARRKKAPASRSPKI